MTDSALLAQAVAERHGIPLDGASPLVLEVERLMAEMDDLRDSDALHQGDPWQAAAWFLGYGTHDGGRLQRGSRSAWTPSAEELALIREMGRRDDLAPVLDTMADMLGAEVHGDAWTRSAPRTSAVTA